MSEFQASNFKKENGGAPDLLGSTELTSPYFFVPPSGDTASRPQSCAAGTLRFNTDIGTLEVYKGDNIGWVQIQRRESQYLGGGTGSNTGTGTRGIKGGGGNPSTDVIEFFTLSTLGNSQDFGDLTASGKAQSGASSRTRGLFAASDSPNSNRIDFITIASAGIDAQDFGDVASGAQRHANGFSNGVRAFFAGGYGGSSPGHCNIIDHVTIAQTGNTVDFGDLSYSMTNGGSCASSTRGIVAGGQNPGYVNNIDHITISSLGSAVDRGGDLTVARRTLGAASNSTRGIFFGGQYANPNSNAGLTNTIDFITIASSGDATDFGDLTFGTNNGAINCMHGMASATRVVMPGGNAFPFGTDVNNIVYVEIATTGNSVDFGTLATRGTAGPGAFSNGHGGL